METLTLKVRISVLWLFFAVAYLVSLVLHFTWPGVIEEIMAGEMEGMQISGGLLLVFALFFVIPLIMAPLAITLRGAANRWTNFVLGIVFAVFTIFDFSSAVTAENLSLALGHLPLVVAAIVVPALIAWQAWKLPRQEA